jgi:type II secretory pathway component PulF
MSLIVTPKDLDQRAELYHQLGSLLSAGVPIIQALEQLERNPPARSMRRGIAKITLHLNQGSTFAEAMRQSSEWMTAFDLALLEAGERSGRLDNCCRLLANYYSSRAKLARKVIGSLIYPVFLFHFAALLFPITGFTDLVLKSNQLAPFLVQKICILGPLYAGVYVLLYLCQGKRGETWRSALESIFHPIPFLGKARRELAVARLASALEALLNAGVPIFGAWELAAISSGSPGLKKRVLSWRPELESGTKPSEMVRRAPEFPEMFKNLYHSGEVSGQLDQTLTRLHEYYEEEGSRKMQAFAQWVPKMVYFGVALLVAYNIVKFYKDYFQQLSDVMK